MRGSRQTLVASLVTLGAIVGCSPGVERVVGVWFRQDAGMTVAGGGPCEVALDIVGDHESITVHEVMPCFEFEGASWVVALDDLGHHQLHFPVADAGARPKAVARYRLAVGERAMDTGDSGAVGPPLAESTGTFSTDEDAAVTLENGAAFTLRWSVAIWH